MFPGGKGPYCNDTCGSHRFYLEFRTCTPTQINLPRGLSCETIDTELTSRASETACEPFVPCKGEKKIILDKYRWIESAIFWGKDMKLKIQGDMGDWSDWSDCSANCSLGEVHGEKTRARSLRESPHLQEPEVQVQPCKEDCPPGDTEFSVSHCIIHIPQIALK